MTRPGKVNLLVLVTSFVPRSARLEMILAAAEALISCSSAMAFAMALLVMALIGAFVPFMGAMLQIRKRRKADRLGLSKKWRP